MLNLWIGAGLKNADVHYFMIKFASVHSTFFFASGMPGPYVRVVFPSSGYHIVSTDGRTADSRMSFGICPGLHSGSRMGSLLFGVWTFGLGCNTVLTGLLRVYGGVEGGLWVVHPGESGSSRFAVSA